MSPNPYAERRPGGVTFVIALTWIVAFLSIVSGFLTLMGQDSRVAAWPSAWPRAAASPVCW
jgi:uncharacterized membrane protein YphA (DoxX/SURF4 family)